MMEVLNHLSTLLLLSLLPPSLSHVVGKFSDVKECSDFFMERTTPNLPGILVDGEVNDQNRYQPICQKYNNKYRFATLYDKIKRIPVFSAYIFTGLPPTGRPKQPWMIEPQLEASTNQLDMMGKSKNIINQAADADYKVKIENMEIDRGHLFPCSHAPDMEIKKSTFTLTNAVPQASSFNRVSWRTMECRVRKKLKTDCVDNKEIKAYVVTGAVPSTNNELNNRVNIPSLLWTAYCCKNKDQDKWVAGAHWGENKEVTGKNVKGEKTTTTTTLASKTLAELYEMLSKHYTDGVKVFPDDCQNGNVEVGQKRKGQNNVKPKEKKRPKNVSKRETGDESEENDCDFDCDEE